MRREAPPKFQSGIFTRSAYRNLTPWQWLAVFSIFALLLRWGSFFITVINHDESTYIVIADELLRGEVYLRDVIDTKPIGIFWIYAAMIKVTGGSIPLLRCLSALIVALGGWGLYLAGRKALLDERAGIAAGLIYCIISSVFTYYGVSPNTEIFFNLFTIFAVAVGVSPHIGSENAGTPWLWGLSGVLLGFAMIIKPFAAAEALAIGLFLIWFHIRAGRYVSMFLNGLLLIAGFALPLLGVFLYYRSLGMLDVLQFYLFEVNGAYPVELAWYLRLKYMGDYLLRFSPVVILGALALVQRKNGGSKRLDEWTKFLFVELLLVSVVVLLTGKRFGHYQVQLHPPLAALAGAWWAVGRPAISRLSGSWIKTYTPSILLVFALALSLGQFSRFSRKDDDAMRIVDYLRPKLKDGETFFGINGWQINHHLLGRDVPTPYVHSSLLFLDHHVRAFQINEAKEAERLLTNPRLVYLYGRIVDKDAETPLKAALLTQFAPVDTLDGEIVIYRRKE